MQTPWYSYVPTHLTVSDPPCQQIMEDLSHGPQLILDSSLIETEQSDTHSFSPSHGGLEEDQGHSTTAAPTSISKNCKAHVASAIAKSQSTMCAFAVSLVEVHQLAVTMLSLLIRRCGW